MHRSISEVEEGTSWWSLGLADGASLPFCSARGNYTEECRPGKSSGVSGAIVPTGVFQFSSRLRSGATIIRERTPAEECGSDVEA